MTVRADAPPYVEGLDEILSGWLFRSDETQDLQMDDFDNPGMLFVEQAAEVWDTEMGAEGKSCASCHGDVEEGMKGVRAVYPKWNEEAGEVHTLEMQVNDCLTERMGAEAWDYIGSDDQHDGADLVGLARHAGGRRDRRAGPGDVGEGQGDSTTPATASSTWPARTATRTTTAI